MVRTAVPLLVACFVAVVATAGCGGDDGSDDGGDETTLFAADYAETYVEVRDCRLSIEHARQIRVLADPAALAPYRDRVDAFPEGAVVLKEEYEFGDDCTGPIIGWTVMKRAADGSAEDTLGWQWEETDGERIILNSDLPRCIGCHTDCGVPPDGYDATCAVP